MEQPIPNRGVLGPRSPSHYTKRLRLQQVFLATCNLLPRSFYPLGCNMRNTLGAKRGVRIPSPLAGLGQRWTFIACGAPQGHEV